MPKLPTPQSDPRLPQQVFTAESQGASVARANQELARSVTGLGEALIQRQTRREISQLNAEMAKAQAELTVEWQETLRTADPNDPEVANRFRSERVQSRLNELSGIAKSREAKDYFTRLSAGLGADFLVRTEAGMSHLEEVAAVQSFETMKNQLVDSISADPLSFDMTLQTVDTMVEGYVQSFNLSREAALKLTTETKQDLAFSAARGRIDNNINEGRAFVDSGGYSEFLSPQQKAQLLNYADSLEASEIAAAKRAKEEMDRAAQLDWMQRISDGTYSFKELTRDPRLDADSMRALDSAARAQAEGTGANNKMKDYNAQRDMQLALAGEITRMQVIQNMARGDYDQSRANVVLDIVDGNATPEGQQRNAAFADFEKTAAATLIKENPYTGQTDPRGRARYAEFMAEVRRLDAQARDRGEPFDTDKWLARLESIRPPAGQLIEERLEGVSFEFGIDGGKPKFNSIEEYEASKGGK